MKENQFLYKLSLMGYRFRRVNQHCGIIHRLHCIKKYPTDFYEFTDVRSSPDNVVVHMSEGLEPTTSDDKTDPLKYDPLLERNLEHPTS